MKILLIQSTFPLVAYNYECYKRRTEGKFSLKYQHYTYNYKFATLHKGRTCYGDLHEVVQV